MVKFKENYHFSRFQRGSNIFQGGGGPTFSRGVQLLIPYRNPYNLCFSRGVRTPCPPPPPPSLDPHLHASFEWLTKTLVGHCMHTVVDATWTGNSVRATGFGVWTPCVHLASTRVTDSIWSYSRTLGVLCCCRRSFRLLFYTNFRTWHFLPERQFCTLYLIH